MPNICVGAARLRQSPPGGLDKLRKKDAEKHALASPRGPTLHQNSVASRRRRWCRPPLDASTCSSAPRAFPPRAFASAAHAAADACLASKTAHAAWLVFGFGFGFGSGFGFGLGFGLALGLGLG